MTWPCPMCGGPLVAANHYDAYTCTECERVYEGPVMVQVAVPGVEVHTFEAP